MASASARVLSRLHPHEPTADSPHTEQPGRRPVQFGSSVSEQHRTSCSSSGCQGSRTRPDVSEAAARARATAAAATAAVPAAARARTAPGWAAATAATERARAAVARARAM
eukprot:scaffold64541_cov70-Phaeocystis_antarctica.AAC.1